MKNQYELKGQSTRLFIERPDGERLEFIIGTEDLPITLQICNNGFSYFINNHY